MATGSTTSNSSISTITGYCVFSEAQYGSNGTSGGAPEYDVGGTAGGSVSGRIVWDGSSGGFDSSWVSTTLTAQAGGGSAGIIWNVTGGSPATLTFTGQTYGTITQVQIRAAVQIPAEFHWQNVVVTFYRNNRVTEQYTQTTGPEVVTTGSTPPVAAEQILTVTPGFTTNTKVVVQGQVRLICAAGITPSAEDIFSQIFVFTNSCA